jgi:hypothetical protein
MQGEYYTICDDLRLVTKIYKKKHRNETEITSKTEAYIQSLVLKKTYESISFERRRGLEEEDG